MNHVNPLALGQFIWTFTFGDQVLEVEDEFIYLGVSFDYKGQFFKARTFS